jgi:hypothetical protein
MVKTIPSGQRMPRDRIGDKKGSYPERTKATRQHTQNVTSQVLRHGKQGMSVANWDMFGAYGNKGRELGKRKMRIQNSPVPHTREHTSARFDKNAGKLVKTDKQRRFSVK